MENGRIGDLGWRRDMHDHWNKKIRRKLHGTKSASLGDRHNIDYGREVHRAAGSRGFKI